MEDFEFIAASIGSAKVIIKRSALPDPLKSFILFALYRLPMPLNNQWVVQVKFSHKEGRYSLEVTWKTE